MFYNLALKLWLNTYVDVLPGVPLCLLEESRALISRCQCSKDDKPLWAVMYTRLKLIARRLRNKFWRWVIRSINFIKPCPDAAAAKIGGKFASKKTRENSTRKKQGKVRLEKDRGKFDSKKTGESSTRKRQGKIRLEKIKENSPGEPPINSTGSSASQVGSTSQVKTHPINPVWGCIHIACHLPERSEHFNSLLKISMTIATSRLP